VRTLRQAAGQSQALLLRRGQLAAAEGGGGLGSAQTATGAGLLAQLSPDQGQISPGAGRIWPQLLRTPQLRRRPAQERLGRQLPPVRRRLPPLLLG
jgi:hypothetical protein